MPSLPQWLLDEICLKVNSQRKDSTTLHKEIDTFYLLVYISVLFMLPLVNAYLRFAEVSF